MLDELGKVGVFNTRTNPALQTSTWSYIEELGQQLNTESKVYQALILIHSVHVYRSIHLPCTV